MQSTSNIARHMFHEYWLLLFSSPAYVERKKYESNKKQPEGIGTIYSALAKGKQGHLKFLSQSTLINLHDCLSFKATHFTFTKV